MQVLLLTLLLLPACIQGLKCYSCQTHGDLDPRCEKNPAAVTSSGPVITCNMKYCTTRRQEYLDPPGVVSSFYRGCEERPLYTNQVVTSSVYLTYYRACTTDLCNSDNGLVTTGSGSGGGWLDGGQTGGSGNTGTVLVPGTGGAASVVATAVLVATAAIAALAHRL